MYRLRKNNIEKQVTSKEKADDLLLKGYELIEEPLKEKPEEMETASEQEAAPEQDEASPAPKEKKKPAGKTEEKVV